ncbi:glycine cleavage system protein GcvH [Rubellicoccus peritrichatus]|uniref:Glycine cleavage system H protein n=1 Tax=Rubellicoccus peritrichatus TaxID=3080537 RepID=A0AAQ3L7Z9_9BACT|nr:glycine cleavage system protein GcvH [Puniceicoccus sp. CR14]WOO39579.1 glycine cleavage system protein GcvH [Puniceicoccus sp. CR14]
MSDIPSDLKYTKQHEWVRVEGDLATIGITDYAQGSLGDITFIELPNVGDSMAAHETFGVVESVKAASDIYMPISGEIAEINESLEDAPENANNDPYGDGWIVKIKISNPSDLDALLDASAYEAETAS